MLRRSYRLGTKQFNEVIRTGKIFHSDFFMARVSPAAGQTRIAAVAPVKIAKTAVLRNRGRRRIYAAIAPFRGEIAAGRHVIIIAKAGMIEAAADAAGRDLRALFVKAGLLR